MDGPGLSFPVEGQAQPRQIPCCWISADTNETQSVWNGLRRVHRGANETLDKVHMVVPVSGSLMAESHSSNRRESSDVADASKVQARADLSDFSDVSSGVWEEWCWQVDIHFGVLDPNILVHRDGSQ